MSNAETNYLNDHKYFKIQLNNLPERLIMTLIKAVSRADSMKQNP
jgi:hypothetical protein